MNVKINKAKIKKSLFIDADYTRYNADGTYDTIHIVSDQVVHEDLIEAFSQMNDVLAKVCDIYELENEEIVHNVRFTGFAKKGSGDSESIILIGSRKVTAGHMNIVSPSIDLCDFSDADIQILNRCMEEVYLYLFEDKHQPSNQMEMEFPEYEEELEESK